MIVDGNRVSIEYTLTLDDGRVVSTNVGADPFVYVHGKGEIPLALESGLADMNVNDSKRISLTPQEAYGAAVPEFFQNVGIEMVPEDARQPGTILAVTDSQGRTRHVRIHEVLHDHVVLDFNHELTGERLTFDVRVVNIEWPM